MDSMPPDVMSDSSSSPEPEPSITAQSQAPKRSADAAGLKPGTRPSKSVKRRASKACQCCRSRKVRCNVVEHGAPCTNCRLDEVECIVSESKRKKKWTTNEVGGSPTLTKACLERPNGSPLPMSAHPPYEPLKRNSEHTPHTLYQDLSRDTQATMASSSLYTPNMLMNLQRLGRKSSSVDETAPMISSLLTPTTPSYSLPLYLKPLPSRLSLDDVLYLEKKGALSIPAVPLRDELLRCYAQFVHPYMPLLNIHDVVRTIDQNDGSSTVSVLLFQAMMFAGIATVDIRYLKAAGWDSRRDARREFFQKTRLLYDFDVEVDRISLIQSLLLMTYWYETPDDQKDSHHWMGIAVSLSHTIGLHRNPDKSLSMDAPRRRLWKRIWWATYMRDRLVALGMRRPTRIKDADFDVPMLELDDFESDVIPDGPSCIPQDCTILRDVEKQNQLAVMCIEKAKLCICISHVLSVQYSVLHNNHGVVSEEGTTRTTMMLVAKRLDPEVDEVQACDNELRKWKDTLASDAKYVDPSWHDVDSGNEDVVLNRALLHMVYFATLSALHRPQVLPSTAMPPRHTQSEQLEMSRKAVRLAATEITKIANRLFELNMVRFLPTPGITVLLPAIIIHLLDIKAPDEATRRASLQGFCQCMQIMSRLRDIYAAADYSTAFLEAAIRKAEITLPQRANEIKESRSIITCAQGLLEAGRRMTSGPEASALTPPPDAQQTEHHQQQNGEPTLTDDDIAWRLNSYLASTPPDSDHQPCNESLALEGAIQIPADFEPDFDSLINLDAAGETWVLDDGAYAAMQGGESSGFAMDMDWMKTNVDEPAIPPSSPPIAEYDISVASPTPSSPRGRLPGHVSELLSPETVRLPPPRTPASTRSRYRDNSSEYYTAAWGSPYERSASPSPSGSARTALSEQAPSEEQLGSSPIPSFGLEHLIPSRLPGISLPQPELSRLGVAGRWEEEDDSHTPRSRTKRWVQLPQRQHSDRTQWWSDGSQGVSDKEGPAHKATSSSASAQSGESRVKRHKPREENRTLNQQSFLELVREGAPEDMASLYASRWAATPPPELNTPAQKDVSDKGKGEGQDREEFGSRKQDDEAATNDLDPGLPTPEQATGGDGEQDGGAGKASEDGLEAAEASGIQHTSDVEANEESKDVNASERSVKEAGSVSYASRLEPSRIRKRVGWRGKTCVINIPSVDFHSLGLDMPMSSEETSARLQGFEDAGYDTRGFVLSHTINNDDVLAHGRPIYPNETELREEAAQRKPNVLLPDLNRAKREAEKLIEQKLAALGVSIGNDDVPTAFPPPAQDMSRQSSGQYPPLPFSPPLPPGSAGSMGRPPFMRAHSHTMSMASPMSPGNGPFGHMHRHSTFSGPMGFPQLQTQQPMPPQLQHSPQSPLPGMQAFSPQKQFGMPGFPRGGSPAQLAALRSDIGAVRGPGSPLNQQMFAPSPQDYSRGLMQDQRQRQHAYSQSVQHQPMPMSMPKAFVPQVPIVQQTPALPELPEEDDEEDLMEPAPQPPTHESDPPAYVPPHKRAQFNADVAIPTPTRGHRHNISEGLERDILESEQRHEADRRNWIEVIERSEESESTSSGAQKSFHRPTHSLARMETDPLSEDLPVQETASSHKKSTSRFNVTAPSFNFNPTASFQPTAPAFSFGAPAPTSKGTQAKGHNRRVSSGNFNAAAPAFTPATMPTSDFSFSTRGPSFKPGAAVSEPTKAEPDARTIIDDLPSIFGKVNISSIVKPARKSKAVAIVRPEESKPDDSEEHEDEEGRPVQSDDRLKRQRRDGDDGDNVPQFAEMPGPADFTKGGSASEEVEDGDEPALGATIVGFEPAVAEGVDGESEEDEAAVSDAGSTANDLMDSPSAAKSTHGHKPSSSLSALAMPFEPPTLRSAVSDEPAQADDPFGSISDLEDGEIREDGMPVVSPVPAIESMYGHDSAQLEPRRSYDYPASERIDRVAHPEPSFDEIDAVMRQLNEDDTLTGAEDPAYDPRALSPLPDFDEHAMDGVSYLPSWPRSDAPSPSPRRRQVPDQAPADSSFTVHDRTDSAEHVMNGWANVTRLNKVEDVPASDWSGVLSPLEEEKLQHRSAFFDTHIDDLIGRVVERRLLPLEESLRTIQTNVARRSLSADRPVFKRKSSNVESDADDEDDLSDELRHRPMSRGRDKRIDQIKAAVLEALREQSPRRSQSSYDIADLHSALADMKVSFARAASASLELDDVRAVVEEVLQRQTQALPPPAGDENAQSHRRELSELEGRLNETLAGALEEANQRRDTEERATETQRLLRLAEEELNLLRDSSHDDDGKFAAMEEERRELLERAEKAEDGQRRAEEQAKELEQESEALQATLEEYRTSSSKWRHDVDDGAREREDLENTIAALERQLEDAQDAGSGMKRRLETLHAHMATAAGQLASEKAGWRSREDDYRVRCETLEAQQAAQARQRHELEEEVRVLRADNADAQDVRAALEHTKAANVTLDEVVRKLHSELAEQQSLAARYERDFHDARESGRVEVYRTRMSLETDVEAANHQVNIARAELESELLRVRTELDNVRMEAEMAKARHERVLEEEDAARREALRKINHSSSVALDEARQKHDATLQELAAQHQRALRHALEDKERSEYILNERLVLSEAKLQHSHDRILHLEERLEVAKSAAQAAAMSAQSRTMPVASATKSSLPERVSPQALRESILVLQEQLQDRESLIDRLQNQVDKEGPTTLKERDSEISWLRELLAVRNEDLTELVNTLARPVFDRDAVRDTAIRIRANLQMEQQEKERLGYSAQALGGQALASLSSFATPKAASLTTAFNKWRSTMENSSLKSSSNRMPTARSSTPSKPAATYSIPPSYMAGLMTPPASNLRTSPSPEAINSLSPPRSHSRPVSSRAPKQPLHARPEALERRVSTASAASDGPTTPLFREQSYDRDAEDSKVHLQSFEDDDLDLPDDEAPAFRNLATELDASFGDHPSA